MPVPVDYGTIGSIPEDWMPVDMPIAEKQAIAARYPIDPHRAAGVAWETWAAYLLTTGDGTASVSSVSTGGQSISYGKPVSAHTAAMDVAAWHFARTRRAVLSPDDPNTPRPSTWAVAPSAFGGCGR